jgi:hypothetical protein
VLPVVVPVVVSPVVVLPVVVPVVVSVVVVLPVVVPVVVSVVVVLPVVVPVVVVSVVVVLPVVVPVVVVSVVVVLPVVVPVVVSVVVVLPVVVPVVVSVVLGSVTGTSTGVLVGGSGFGIISTGLGNVTSDILPVCVRANSAASIIQLPIKLIFISNCNIFMIFYDFYTQIFKKLNKRSYSRHQE